MRPCQGVGETIPQVLAFREDFSEFICQEEAEQEAVVGRDQAVHGMGDSRQSGEAKIPVCVGAQGAFKGIGAQVDGRGDKVGEVQRAAGGGGEGKKSKWKGVRRRGGAAGVQDQGRQGPVGGSGAVGVEQPKVCRGKYIFWAIVVYIVAGSLAVIYYAANDS